MNLKGMMVGNGCTDFYLDVSPSFPDTVYNFNLIPMDLYDTYKSNDCFNSFNDVIPFTNTAACDASWLKINNLTGDLNWYDLYRPVYPDSPLVLGEYNRYKEVEVGGEIKRYKRGYTIGEYTPWMKKAALRSPILGDGVTDYVNRPDVRLAMNIPDSLPAW